MSLRVETKELERLIGKYEDLVNKIKDKEIQPIMDLPETMAEVYEYAEANDGIKRISRVTVPDNAFTLSYYVEKAKADHEEENNYIATLVASGLKDPKILKKIAEAYYNNEEVLININILPYANDVLIFKDIELNEMNPFKHTSDEIIINLAYSEPEVIYPKIHKARKNILNKLREAGLNVSMVYDQLVYKLHLKKRSSGYGYIDGF